jgi:hypothetical protein
MTFAFKINGELTAQRLFRGLVKLPDGTTGGKNLRDKIHIFLHAAQKMCGRLRLRAGIVYVDIADRPGWSAELSNGIEVAMKNVVVNMLIIAV